jgi:hypothetical protein
MSMIRHEFVQQLHGGQSVGGALSPSASPPGGIQPAPRWSELSWYAFGALACIGSRANAGSQPNLGVRSILHAEATARSLKSFTHSAATPSSGKVVCP